MGATSRHLFEFHGNGLSLPAAHYVWTHVDRNQEDEGDRFRQLAFLIAADLFVRTRARHWPLSRVTKLIQERLVAELVEPEGADHGDGEEAPEDPETEDLLPE